MSYNSITNTEVQEGAPLDGALLGKIKGNFEAHESNLGDDDIHLTTHDLQIDSQQTAINNLGTSVNLKAPIASPTFTGTPSAPTATAGTSTTQVATTAFVTTADNLKANILSPALTGTPTAPTATTGTNNSQIANTAFVKTAVDAVDMFTSLTASLKSGNGYAWIPIKIGTSIDKILVQWMTGNSQAQASNQAVNYPIAFPNNVFQVVVGSQAAAPAGVTVSNMWVSSITNSNVTISIGTNGGAAAFSQTPRIIAIGY
jgi:hypothetical protein